MICMAVADAIALEIVNQGRPPASSQTQLQAFDAGSIGSGAAS